MLPLTFQIKPTSTDLYYLTDKIFGWTLVDVANLQTSVLKIDWLIIKNLIFDREINIG